MNPRLEPEVLRLTLSCVPGDDLLSAHYAGMEVPALVSPCGLGEEVSIT